MSAPAFEKRVGSGCTIGVDYTGGTTYTVLGTIVDGGKTDAKWKAAKTTLLSELADTFAKTSYDPGEFTFILNYDPQGTEYTRLKTNFAVVNAAAPHWEISFPDTGAGSGATTDTFFALITGLSREVKKDEYCVCEVTLKLTGQI